MVVAWVKSALKEVSSVVFHEEHIGRKAISRSYTKRIRVVAIDAEFF